jgi:hypothetical protein
MFVGRCRYALVRSFVEGFGAARDDGVLHGFQQWLSGQPQHHAISNFAWPSLLLHEAFPERDRVSEPPRREDPAAADLSWPLPPPPRSARTTSPTPKTTPGQSLTCSHGSASTSTPGQPQVTASRTRPDQPRSPGHDPTGRPVRGPRPIQRSDRPVRERHRRHAADTTRQIEPSVRGPGYRPVTPRDHSPATDGRTALVGPPVACYISSDRRGGRSIRGGCCAATGLHTGSP